MPLHIATEKVMVYFESHPYASLEMGLKRKFHPDPYKILQFFKFLEKSNHLSKISGFRLMIIK